MTLHQMPTALSPPFKQHRRLRCLTQPRSHLASEQPPVCPTMGIKPWGVVSLLTFRFVFHQTVLHIVVSIVLEYSYYS